MHSHYIEVLGYVVVETINSRSQVMRLCGIIVKTVALQQARPGFYERYSYKQIGLSMRDKEGKQIVNRKRYCIYGT